MFNARTCIFLMTNSSDRAVSGVRLWPLVFLELQVRIPQGHESLFLVVVVCYQEEVSASGRSLVQRSRTVCGA
jgi:hypothetical protein